MKNKIDSKKIIALLFTVVILLSTTGCFNKGEVPDTEEEFVDSEEVITAQNDPLYDEEEEDEFIDEDYEAEAPTDLSTPEDIVFENPEEPDLNEAIEKIVNMQFKTDSKSFKKYDINTLVDEEFRYLENDNYLARCNPERHPIDYSWYNDGVINQEALYKQIIAKTMAYGIRITSDIKRIAKEVPKAAQSNVTYLIENHPDFPLNHALYYLNRIHVNITDEDYAVGMYVIGGDELLVNFDNVQDQQDFEKVVAHELFHMFLLRTTGANLYAASSSYDSWKTEECPLSQIYFEEWYVEYFACSALDFEPDHLWTVREKQFVDIMCASIGENYHYFEKIALGLDDNGLLKAVEPELRNRAFVYSTLHAFELGNDYNTIPSGYNEEELRSACKDYAIFNFLKNAYIRNMKDVAKGEKSYIEATEDVNDLHNLIWDACFDTNDELNEQISDMETVFYDFCSNYA